MLCSETVDHNIVSFGTVYIPVLASYTMSFCLNKPIAIKCLVSGKNVFAIILYHVLLKQICVAKRAYIKCKAEVLPQSNEPRSEKTVFLHMRKQRRRSASR